MDKRQLWLPTVMPSWCCALLAPVDFTVSIPRDIAVVPAVNPSFWGCFSWVQKSWGQQWFSLPLPGVGLGILWKEGAATEGHSGGEQLCWHKWEAVPRTKHNLSKCNRRCPAITMPPFLLHSNYRKCGSVVTAGSLSEFSNPCLLPLLPSSCVLVSANTFSSCCSQCWDEQSLQASSSHFGIRGSPITARYYLQYVSFFLKELI